jgi:Flp pilus assembly pilin Flp
MRFWKELWEDEDGAVATEYVILVGLIAIALIAVIVLFREKLYSLIQGFIASLGGVDKEAGTGTTPP